MVIPNITLLGGWVIIDFVSFVIDPNKTLRSIKDFDDPAIIY